MEHVFVLYSQAILDDHWSKIWYWRDVTTWLPTKEILMMLLRVFKYIPVRISEKSEFFHKIRDVTGHQHTLKNKLD
jgi:hypothetical protein